MTTKAHAKLESSPRAVLDRLRSLLSGSVEGKLSVAVIIAVTVGVVGLVVFFTTVQERHILRQNERTMRSVAESVSQSLQTVMLAGYADIAKDFADRLKTVPDVVDFRIVRTDGTEAFRDNKTIEAVNARRGDRLFEPRAKEEVVRVLGADDPHLQETVNHERMLTVYEAEAGPGGENYLTFLAPIVDNEACSACHDPDHRIHGVIKLTTSLEPVERDVQRTWALAALTIVVWLALIILVTRYLIRRSVVRPLEVVSGAMARVAAGDLNQEVPVVRADELGMMARSFNRMTARLLETYGGLQDEQNKLTTIILAAVEGIVVTDSDMNIVLVNPSAEALLGKTFAEIMAGGFENILDDPHIIRRCLARADAHPATETVTYNDRILSIAVATIRAEDGTHVGSSALLRDVTEEKRLEAQLRRLSTTDALTGLRNRRFLDEELSREVDRARRYGLPLSIMMFDIDHFKRLNDTYGHDRGDVVLKEVAARVMGVVRRSDTPCRYGGEEFLVIMPGTEADGALALGERLRESIAKRPIDRLKVTVTVGVANFAALGVATAQELVEAADQALYEGKRTGRDRVVMATPSPGAGGAR